MTRRALKLTDNFRRSFREWTERADISQEACAEIVILPDHPKIKNYARTVFGKDGSGPDVIRVEQVMQVECCKCHAPQEFAVHHDVSPAVMRGRIDVGDEVGSLLDWAMSAEADARSAESMVRWQSEELRSRRFVPAEGWTEYVDDVMDGADVY